MSKRDGGPAFPGVALPEPPNHPVGMSKREYFAGQIMAGLVSDPGLQLFDETQKAGTATHAVSLADALLEALAQGEQS